MQYFRANHVNVAAVQREGWLNTFPEQRSNS